MGGGLCPPAPSTGAAPLDPACFWIEEPSRNRLGLNGISSKKSIRFFEKIFWKGFTKWTQLRNIQIYQTFECCFLPSAEILKQYSNQINSIIKVNKTTRKISRCTLWDLTYTLDNYTFFHTGKNYQLVAIELTH